MKLTLRRAATVVVVGSWDDDALASSGSGIGPEFVWSLGRGT
jgi:hypothetical protein